MHSCAKKLTSGQNEKDFEWPKSYKEWISLPGIGEYTASGGFKYLSFREQDGRRW